MEAYQQVNAPEQLDEVLDTPEKANEYARKNVRSMLGAFAKGVANKDISQLKTIEKRKRGAELGKRKAERKAAEEQKESFDIFDVVLEFLQAEGYAETLEEAEWMMANLIDEEAVAIILGEEQLDELSNRTVSNALNARIAATGAASDRAYKHRHPQAMRAAETAADKEARMKGAVARRRARMNKEDFELWVNEFVEEGYDLSDYTWDEMYEFYLDEAIYSEKGKAKAAEMIAKRSTPSGRAKSGKGANVAQIRQIRGSGRGRFDREGLGGTPMTPTMAKNPIKKQNYDGTGNKAARRAGTYQEAFESWLY